MFFFSSEKKGWLIEWLLFGILTFLIYALACASERKIPVLFYRERSFRSVTVTSFVFLDVEIRLIVWVFSLSLKSSSLLWSLGGTRTKEIFTSRNHLYIGTSSPLSHLLLGKGLLVYLFISYPHFYYLLLLRRIWERCISGLDCAIVHHFLEGSESKGQRNNLTVYLKEKLQNGCANSKGRRLVIHPGSRYTWFFLWWARTPIGKNESIVNGPIDLL